MSSNISKVVAKAWVDEDFKTRLLNDPKAVLIEEGIDVPENFTVRTIETKEDEVIITLPPAPDASLTSLAEANASLVCSSSVACCCPF